MAIHVILCTYLYKNCYRKKKKKKKNTNFSGNNPHQHIWTNIAGLTENSTLTRRRNCHCSDLLGRQPRDPLSVIITTVNRLIHLTYLILDSSIAVISYGTVSSAVRKVLVVPLSLPHGSVWSSLILQVMTLKYVSVVIITLMTKTFQSKF